MKLVWVLLPEKSPSSGSLWEEAPLSNDQDLSKQVDYPSSGEIQNLDYSIVVFDFFIVDTCEDLAGYDILLFFVNFLSIFGIVNVREIDCI